MFLEPRNGIADIKISNGESFLNFGPLQWHRYRSAGLRSQGVWCCDRSLWSILKKIQIHFSLTIGYFTLNSSETRKQALNPSNDRPCKFLRIFIGVFCSQW